MPSSGGGPLSGAGAGWEELVERDLFRLRQSTAITAASTTRTPKVGRTRSALKETPSPSGLSSFGSPSAACPGGADVDGGIVFSGGTSGCSGAGAAYPSAVGKSTSAAARHISSPPEAKVTDTVPSSGKNPERAKLVTYNPPVSSARTAAASAAVQPSPTT